MEGRGSRGAPPSGGTPFRYQLPQFPIFVLGLLLIPAVLGLGAGYWWFVQRVEVGPSELLVLVRKFGRALPAEAGDQVVLYPALLERLGVDPGSTRYSGVMYDVRPEGRYFFDPLFWERIIVPATFIDAGKREVGVLIRKYGDPLPPGQTVATQPNQRGPVTGVLEQGRHNINPYAYDVVRYPMVQVPEGSVGVQTLYAGNEPKNPNVYVVERGERGVQPDVLPPGLYQINPYEKRIDAVDVRSHTIDLRGDEAIRFPSNDSFEILIDGTIEFAIRQDTAPYVMVAIGDHEDIKDKIILPHAKSLARIEGSKLIARDFITGERRRVFQDRVFEGLRESCYQQGIEIRAVLVRRIEPPAAIAGPISERQIALQQISQYQNEIKVARSQARLVEQEEQQKQNQEVGKANREVVAVTTEAEQARAVALTQANQRLEVARLGLEAAAGSAAAIRTRGQADAEVVLIEYTAKARPLAEAVQAFGSGEAYAQYFFYQKLAPALKSVLDSTEGPFSDIFRALTPNAMPATPPRPPTPAASGSAAAAHPPGDTP